MPTEGNNSTTRSNFSAMSRDPRIYLNANGSSGLNPSSPTFQAAQQACQGHLSFKGKPAQVGSGGGSK